ncbi:MAG: redoxin family protein [Bacteroidaceae bacterium]|nr:redoxin family protein [Bacteroidaceae bacterium]
MKKQIITILLALCALAGQAKNKAIVWEQSSMVFTNNHYFQLSKVELSKQQTKLFCTYLKGERFMISKDSYLQADGKIYPIVSADSITLGEFQALTGSDEPIFVLNFKPLPLKTKEFDFIEGMEDDNFRVYGIHDSFFSFPVAPIPDEFRANYSEDDQLEEMQYSEEPAIVRFKAINYRKGMKPYITAQYVDLKNPTEPKNVDIRMNDEGEAVLSLAIGVPQLVWCSLVTSPWRSNCNLYFAPGKEVTVLVDMLKANTNTNNKFVGYKGFFAKYANEYYQTIFELTDKEHPMKKDAKTVEELIRDYDDYNADSRRLMDSLNIHGSPRDVWTQMTWEPDYDFDRCGAPIDSLAKTSTFTEHILQHHTTCLNNKKTVLTYNFVVASHYYAMKTDARGFVADLARYCYFLPKVLDGQKVTKPLIEDTSLSALYDSAVAEYEKSVAANKEGMADNAHYLDMTDIAPEDILQAILDKYKGEAVLIDIWATWCGPCRLGHQKLAPMKEELRDRGIRFVYITSLDSPVDDWKKQIADIPGDHYFLTNAQCKQIMKAYQSGGYPTYSLHDADGKLTYTIAGFPGVDKIKAEIEKVLK